MTTLAAIATITSWMAFGCVWAMARHPPTAADLSAGALFLFGAWAFSGLLAGLVLFG